MKPMSLNEALCPFNLGLTLKSKLMIPFAFNPLKIKQNFILISFIVKRFIEKKTLEVVHLTPPPPPWVGEGNDKKFTDLWLPGKCITQDQSFLCLVIYLNSDKICHYRPNGMFFCYDNDGNRSHRENCQNLMLDICQSITISYELNNFETYGALVVFVLS